MSELTRLMEEFQRVYHAEPWHGPSLAEIVTDITPTEAAARPFPGVDSICEIVLHIRRMAGGLPVATAGHGSERAREIFQNLRRHLENPHDFSNLLIARHGGSRQARHIDCFHHARACDVQRPGMMPLMKEFVMLDERPSRQRRRGEVRCNRE